jgi:hypothetical protein
MFLYGADGASIRISQISVYSLPVFPFLYCPHIGRWSLQSEYKVIYIKILQHYIIYEIFSFLHRLEYKVVYIKSLHVCSIHYWLTLGIFSNIFEALKYDF